MKRKSYVERRVRLASLTQLVDNDCVIVSAQLK